MTLNCVRILCGTTILTVGALLCAPAYAQSESAPATSPVMYEGQLKFQAVDQNNTNLGAGGNAGLLGAEARLKMTVNINEDALFFWEGRGVGGVGRSGFETSDTGNISNNKNFLEWRQSYFQFSNLGGQPFSIRAGRQRVRESYGNWWNQNFDAVRVGYDTTLFSGFLLAGQDLFSYSTGEDFRKDQKDIFRLLAEGSWQYYYRHFFETRMMYEDDHSGVDGIGAIQSASDRNAADGQLLWAGVRAAGESRPLTDGADRVKYRVDLMGVSGNERVDTTTAAGSNLLVTGIRDRDVLGWGLDAGVDIPLAMNSHPVLHLGYAYGSGDDGTGDDHSFRQSGLRGNFSRVGVLSQSVYNYGTVLRPQLSNIHILAAGFTMPMFQASDAGVLYHYYRLADAATSVTSSVNGTLNGRDNDLGQGIDLLFNTSLYESDNIRAGHINSAYLRTSLGAFRAGDAYGTNEGEIAGRGLIELGFNF